jgi:hypothetical protein
MAKNAPLMLVLLDWSQAGRLSSPLRHALIALCLYLEEFVETFNRTSNQTIDLFEKTLAVYQGTSVPEAQRRVQDLIESSLTTLRVNVHSALNTNAKIIASWQELWTFQPGRNLG